MLYVKMLINLLYLSAILRNNPGERRPHLHRGGILISLSSSYVGISSLNRGLVSIINKKTLEFNLCHLLLLSRLKCGHLWRHEQYPDDT